MLLRGSNSYKLKRKLKRDRYLMRPNTANHLLLETKTICDSLKVPFGVHQGTLLGIIRDGILLPWDHDIDLWLFGDTEQLMIGQIKEQLIKQEFGLWETYYTPEKEIIAWSHKKRNITVGFVLLRPSKDPKFSCDITMFFGKRRTTITLVPHNFFSPPTKVQFLGLEFLAANPPEQYLEMRYGPPWRWRKPMKNNEWKRYCKFTSFYADECPLSPWTDIIQVNGPARIEYLKQKENTGKALEINKLTKEE